MNKIIKTLSFILCFALFAAFLVSCGDTGADTSDTSVDNGDYTTEPEVTEAPSSEDITPEVTIPEETDDPNVFIEINPNDTESKWGSIHVNEQ